VTNEEFAGLAAANRKGRGLTPRQLAEFERAFGVTFPTDYASFLLWANGWEGWIGRESYLRLHGAEGLTLANDSAFRQAFPDLVAIGSDGGLETYALDYRQRLPSPGVVRVDRNSADELDVWVFAEGFSEALAALARD
jgi:hypothetical protein